MTDFAVGDRVIVRDDHINLENGTGTVVTGLRNTYVTVKLDNPPKEWGDSSTCLFYPKELMLLNDKCMYVVWLPIDLDNGEFELIATASTEELAIKYAFDEVRKFYKYDITDCEISKWSLGKIIWVGAISNATNSLMQREYAVECVPFIG